MPLQRSVALLGFIVISHLAAMLVVVLTRLDISLTAFLLLFIAASLLFYCRRYGWLGRKPTVTAIKGGAENRWAIIDHLGRRQSGFELKRSIILGPLIVLYLKPPGRRLTRPVIIFRDALASEHWRQLRIRLRDPETWAK